MLSKCVIYNPAMMAIRMSILFFYLRVFSYPTFRRLVYAMMALATSCTIAFIVGNFTRCKPVQFNWNQNLPGGRCGDVRMFVCFNAASSIILDLMIWALPIPILLSLGFNKRKKYALFFIFSLGLL